MGEFVVVKRRGGARKGGRARGVQQTTCGVRQGVALAFIMIWLGALRWGCLVLSSVWVSWVLLIVLYE